MSSRAIAEIIRTLGGDDTVCGVAVVNRASAGRTLYPVYAGQIPLVPSPLGITVALTEDAGEPADDRQIATRFYDNPVYTLHIISDDLVLADQYAKTVIDTFDRASHIETDYGDINTLRIEPPRRIIRTMRPRYDLQMTVRAEVIRVDGIIQIVIGGYAFTITDGRAYLPSEDYFAGMGFRARNVSITES